VSDIDIAVADSLKVLDLKWPIREATEILGMGREVAIPRCIKSSSRPRRTFTTVHGRSCWLRFSIRLTAWESR
jgi:hypothetical protein